MDSSEKLHPSYIYLTGIFLISVALILINILIGMKIPFSVDFLIGFIACLLVFSLWHSIITKGFKRTLVMFLLAFVISFSAEALGVNFGWVFGDYHYTTALGFQILGVPILAALAWEPILYAAFTLTSILSAHPQIGGWRSRLISSLWLSGVGALATTAWDLMIDPIAVGQGWWVWENGGDYVPYVANGVPISNFIGWLGVSFLCQLIYRLICWGIPATQNRSLDIYGPVTLYAALFLTASGVAISILNRPEVGLIGLLAMGPFLMIGLTNINLERIYRQAIKTAELPPLKIKP